MERKKSDSRVTKTAHPINLVWLSKEIKFHNIQKIYLDVFEISFENVITTFKN